MKAHQRKIRELREKEASKDDLFGKELKQVYWDDVKKMFYWIEWCDTGNNEIPTGHYISISGRE
jgi:hypothetical protein